VYVPTRVGSDSSQVGGNQAEAEESGGVLSVGIACDFISTASDPNVGAGEVQTAVQADFASYSTAPYQLILSDVTHAQGYNPNNNTGAVALASCQMDTTGDASNGQCVINQEDPSENNQCVVNTSPTAGNPGTSTVLLSCPRSSTEDGTGGYFIAESAIAGIDGEVTGNFGYSTLPGSVETNPPVMPLPDPGDPGDGLRWTSNPVDPTWQTICQSAADGLCVPIQVSMTQNAPETTASGQPTDQYITGPGGSLTVTVEDKDILAGAELELETGGSEWTNNGVVSGTAGGGPNDVTPLARCQVAVDPRSDASSCNIIDGTSQSGWGCQTVADGVQCPSYGGVMNTAVTVEGCSTTATFDAGQQPVTYDATITCQVKGNPDGLAEDSTSPSPEGCNPSVVSPVDVSPCNPNNYWANSNVFQTIFYGGLWTPIQSGKLSCVPNSDDPSTAQCAAAGSTFTNGPYVTGALTYINTPSANPTSNIETSDGYTGQSCELGETTIDGCWTASETPDADPRATWTMPAVNNRETGCDWVVTYIWTAYGGQCVLVVAVRHPTGTHRCSVGRAEPLDRGVVRHRISGKRYGLFGRRRLCWAQCPGNGRSGIG
jgi:hypothetical protein